MSNKRNRLPSISDYSVLTYHPLIFFSRWRRAGIIFEDLKKKNVTWRDANPMLLELALELFKAILVMKHDARNRCWNEIVFPRE